MALPGAPLFRRRIAAALLTAIEQRKPMAIVAVHLGDARDWQDVSGPSEVRTVLATYATRLARSLHSRGMLNRSAVYDFSAAVEHIHGEANLAQQLQSLHRTLMEPIVIGGRHVTIRPFIGVAICPFDGLTAEALTKRSAAAAHLAQHDAHEIRFFGASDE